MSTPAQVAANQANAQFSTGPKSDAGKTASSMNNFRHGLTGEFRVLPSEDQNEFYQLRANLMTEYQPASATEGLLVEKMAQHFWLSRRALALQDAALESNQEKQFALYLRYQTTNDRAFHQCLNQLLKIRAEKRKAAIGFESQEQKRELHKWKVLLAQAQVDHRVLLNHSLATVENRLEISPRHTIAAEKAA